MDSDRLSLFTMKLFWQSFNTFLSSLLWLYVGITQVSFEAVALYNAKTSKIAGNAPFLLFINNSSSDVNVMLQY